MSMKLVVYTPVDGQVQSKILCLSWTADGTLLAMGCYDGSVSVRDRAGSERAHFSAGATPAWSLAWSPQVRWS
jgi:intraflagellar transport protein 122